MKTQTEIDETLRLIGNVFPPANLEGRIRARLAADRGRGLTSVHFIAVAALAACATVACVAVSPALRDLATRDLPMHGRWGTAAPRLMMHPAGSFGAASAVHVPAAPIPVAPVPVTQGRGHTRSDRTMLAGTARTPLSHNVAVPTQTHISAHLVSPPHGLVAGQP